MRHVCLHTFCYEKYVYGHVFTHKNVVGSLLYYPLQLGQHILLNPYLLLIEQFWTHICPID